MSSHTQDLCFAASVFELNYLELSYKARLFHMSRMYHERDIGRELTAIGMDLLRPEMKIEEVSVEIQSNVNS